MMPQPTRQALRRVLGPIRLIGLIGLIRPITPILRVLSLMAGGVVSAGTRRLRREGFCG